MWYPNCVFLLSKNRANFKFFGYSFWRQTSRLTSLFFGKLLVVGSVVHGAKLALTEAARHELVSNGVDILVLVHEHGVHAQVSETEVVEGLKGLLHVLIFNLLNSLKVFLLGRLSVDADGALHKEGTRLLGSIISNLSLDFLNEGLGFGHLLVVGGGDFLDDGILFHHLDCGEWLGQLTLEVFVDDGLHGLHTKDVAANLVAELYPARL